MTSFSLRYVQGIIRPLFPTLRKTRMTNLALSVFGVIKAQSGILSEIARYMPVRGKHWYRVRRLWRFVSNTKMMVDKTMMSGWIAWVINRFTPGRHVCIALDWTKLPGDIQCLMIALPYRGRAIPLLWRLVWSYDFKRVDSQNKIEEELIAVFLTLVPLGKRIVVLADRGFGRASFIAFLKECGVLFTLRVKSGVMITTQKGRMIRLRSQHLVPNKPRIWTRVAYRSDGVVRGVHVIGVVATGSDDPWFLVSNLKRPARAIAQYETRFHIEEWFKDMKHELSICTIRTRSVERINRLLLIASVAYGVLMTIAALAYRFTSWYDQLISRKQCSRIWLALRLIEHNIPSIGFWRRCVAWARAGP